VTLAIAAATFGLVFGGLIGGPVGTRLIRRFGLLPRPAPRARDSQCSAGTGARGAGRGDRHRPAGEAPTAYTLLKTLTIILVGCGPGRCSGAWLGHYVTLPGYIGAMLLRRPCCANLADLTAATDRAAHGGRPRHHRARALLSMALMSLKLWELLELALPMLAHPRARRWDGGGVRRVRTFRVMGRDYDAAIMGAGHCGFGLGHANAVPNRTLARRALRRRARARSWWCRCGARSSSTSRTR
jgi:ESS family glutamate:Na+ symporter